MTLSDSIKIYDDIRHALQSHIFRIHPVVSQEFFIDFVDCLVSDGVNLVLDGHATIFQIEIFVMMENE
jgi:hypothetical protein